jgi:hypothetical protein
MRTQKQNKVWGTLLSLAGALILLMVMIAVSKPQTVFATPDDLASAVAKYPNISGTSLQDCALCHAGNPPTPPDLNPYGAAYLANGRSTAAFGLIENIDSDGDGFTNGQEIKTYLTFPGNPASFPPSPKVSVNPATWNFGTQNTGTTSVAKSFTLTNTGTANLIISTLTISGDFALSSNTCNSATIAPAGTCTFGVTFSPTSAAAKTGSVSIPSNAVSSPNSVSLSGTGTTPTAPAVSVNPASWDFGNQNMGTTSAAKSFTLTNTGTANLIISTLTTSGDFALSGNTCNSATVAPVGTCTFDVTFSPTSAAAKTGSVSIPSNAASSPNSVSLSGTGTTPTAPAVSVNPASWNFGNQNMGTISAAKSFTLTNTGTANLIINTLTTSGDFALSGNTCNSATVAPAGTCTFDVTFSPISTGVKSGSVSIPSNAASSPNSIVLSGTGTTLSIERAKNGGFNAYIGKSKLPTFWVKSATFAPTDGKDATFKKEGIASVKIAGAPAKTKTLTQTLALSGLTGDKFTFTFWAKGVSIPVPGLCQGQVFLYNGAALTLTKTIPCKTGTYATFQKKTLSFNATSAYTKVVIKFTYSKAGGTVWFDAVSLMK